MSSRVDLNSGILIEISGECGKFNTLPIETLVDLAHSLQSLINKIALIKIKNKESIDLKNFKIELSGYYQHSAVPAFVFTKKIQHTLGDDVGTQRSVINKGMNDLLKVAHSGNYLMLEKLYGQPKDRADIANAFYSFATSCGNSPMTIVHKKNGNFNQAYKISTFKKEVKKKLGIIENKKVKHQTEVVVGLVRISHGDQRENKKVLESYSNNVVMCFAPKIIKFKNNEYTLKSTLPCIFEKIENYYSITNGILDIIAVGDTENEAIENFSEEFDFIYNRYNELPDEQLTERIKTIKTILNSIVIK